MTAAEEIRDIVAEHMVQGAPIAEALLAVANHIEETEKTVEKIVGVLENLTRTAEAQEGDLRALDQRTIGWQVLG